MVATLGIMEGVDFHTNDVKEQIKKEYYLQLSRIFKSQLNGNSTMTAICAYAVPVLRYTFGIVKWMKGELKNINVKA